MSAHGRGWMRALIAGGRRRGRVTAAALAVLGLLSLAGIGGEAPAGAQQAEGAGVEIRFGDRVDRITRSFVHRFTVEVGHLAATEDYQVRVASDHAPTLGIGGCGTASQTATVTGAAAREAPFLVYACAVGEATVTAEVRRTGAPSAAASVSRRWTVEALPEIVIGPAGERIRTTPPGAAGQGASGTAQESAPDFVRDVRFPNAHVHATSVTATWSEPANGGRPPLTGFGLKLWKEAEPEPGYEPEDVVVVGPATRSQIFSNLQPDTWYNFRIHACNGADSCGYWTNPPVRVKTDPVGRPAKPHSISVDQKMPTSARVKWSPDADTGGVALTGFGIRWRVKGGNWPTHAQAPNVPPGDRRYTMSPLTANTTYQVSLQACNDTDSCSPWTDALEFATSDTTNEPEDTPGPVRDLKITGVGDGTLTVDWEPPSSPSNTVTGYKLQRKLHSNRAWSSTVTSVTTSNKQISGLTDGTSYDVRVQACNGDDCGDWAGPVCGVPGTTTRPGQAALGSGGVTVTGSGSLRVSWDPPSCVSAITHYEVQRKEETVASWPSPGNEVSSETFIVFTGLTIGTPYQVRVRACNSARTTTPPNSRNLQCGAWSAIQGGTPSGVPLPTPMNLNVVPLPERKARLSWDRVTDATGYFVEVQSHGTSLWGRPDRSDSTSGEVAQSNVGSKPGYEIELDEVVSSGSTKLGLADQPAYKFRVTAISSGFSPSGHSRPVTIIDTPITSANGHSPGTGVTSGKAAITWKDLGDSFTDDIFDGGTYQLRHRRSSHNSKSIDWTPGDYDRNEKTNKTSSLSLTIDKITRYRIYAVQLLYEKDNHKVFAARDVYVWPADTPMDQHPIATFEKGQMSTTKTSDGTFAYNYLLCESTFPTGGGASIPAGDHASSWPSYVEHALKQWEYATNGLVKMIRGSASCSTDRQPFLDRIVSVTRDQIRDGEIDSDIDTHIASLVDSFRTHGIQIRKGPLTTQLFLDDDLASEDALVSEILMIRDAGWSDDDKVVEQFRQQGSAIGLPHCGRGACAQHSEARLQGGGTVYSTDIYLRESVHSNRIRLGSREEDKRITFNTCPNTNVHYNYPYSSLIHEAGHAIGFGGTGDHETVPNVKESMMSYYRELPKCAPHPLDVMIVYAMYQSRG